ncbi:hypothetical protein ACFXPA_23140 [Amycolatopsis sp. NPDC059090]|uniref:hypothetical protein n=1 Tax=unclassified Amycolatopsis TaxID=2618356 RepID=UPI003670B6D9
MTRPPVPLSPAQQQDLVQQIGQAAAAALPAGWQQLQVVCRAAGRHVEVDVNVLAPDNRTYPVQPHPELPRLFGALRTGMYQPGRGTWLSATLVFSPQRPPFTDYQPDAEPRWRQIPPPIGFQDELRFFPREDRFVPPWLRHRAGSAVPPPAVPGAGGPTPPPAGAGAGVAAGSGAGQPVPPHVPGSGPAVPPPLPDSGQVPPPLPDSGQVPPPLPDSGQVPPPLPGVENPVPSTGPATPPPLPGTEQAADAEQSAPAIPVDQPNTPPPLPGAGPAADIAQPVPALPVDEPNAPPSLPGAEQAADAETPARALPMDDNAPLPEAGQPADSAQSIPALPVDEPTTPPPLPGTEQAADAAQPVTALPVHEPHTPLPEAGQPADPAQPIPALPIDEPITSPPLPDAEQAVSPSLAETAVAVPASVGDEAQSEPSEVAAAGIAAETSGPEAAADEVAAEALSTASVPESVVAQGEQGESATAAGQAGELRTPRVYDRFDEAGNPVVEREALSPEERERVLSYLDSAPVILASRSNDTDAFDPSRTDAVPLNFRTDGSWVWPGAVGYYLREHGISPDPELVEHIRAANYTVPEVDEATQQRMLAAMTSPPAEESRPEQPSALQDPDELLSEISAALVAAAPQGWQRIVFDFMALGRHANLACGARMADGSTQQVPVARELSRPLAQLRRSKYVQGRGTWYTLSLAIDPPSSYQASFNEDDEPAFHTPPRPEDYALDQELYPRDEDYLPLWFSLRLPESPQ